MKVAISSSGKESTGQVSTRLGRCQYFIIYNTENGKSERVENKARFSPGGAGIATAKNLADMGVDAVVTGFIGPKAFSALKAAGITMYTGARGTVEETYELFRQNKLSIAQSPNAGAHSGM
ncbi:NifB/NifX family molybdenum-iron cluster-binding protein [Desulfofalx alkaliphila]|uniref:NifB/NifX family molybdenum-iron cluster-binding protein n=1 Tax=Desulfofalx alkaliphila TaxID=105483 RepID=UPI0004E0F2C3|nr:NifB/NifX family molybdenum-iron cluster-binding protein [Desulfofalx alkaliphila]